MAQLPGAELPKAHFANCHQGCPNCGTAIFRFSGFYPWVRNHHPCDFKSECPNCGSVYPSNDLADEDYISGEYPDDGYGCFDAEGHIYLFAATYHRDQCRSFNSGIAAMTHALRAGGFDEARARQLGLLLLRYAEEELYLASVPQFRYGPSKGVEEPWDWGQPDWADELDPVQALRAKGSIRYSIDTPYLIECLALAYDTVWPADEGGPRTRRKGAVHGPFRADPRRRLPADGRNAGRSAPGHAGQGRIQQPSEGKPGGAHCPALPGPPPTRGT